MLHELTRRVMDGGDLDEGQAEAALEAILEEETPDAAIASFLTALTLKGETDGELAGFARVMRRHALRVEAGSPLLVDTAGTGGGRETFNISTTAAFVIAGAGVPVAKHGNRAVTSRSGSADLLEALGLNLDLPLERARAALGEVGIAFLFAPHFHPAMKRVAGLRRQLAHRTIFNLLGPLTNPAGAGHQLIGVYAPELTEVVARALARLECRSAWVVHGGDGLDELTTAAPSRVSEVREGQVRTFELDPAGIGLLAAGLDDYPAGTPRENAELTLGILEGRVSGHPREVVVLNAAAALHLARDMDLTAALDAARESIDSGQARTKLRDLIEFCAC